MAYITLPLETDGRQLATDILDRLMGNIPGWVPREGNLEVWIVEAIANALAEVLGVASRMDRSIFRYFGKSLIGLLPIDGAPASVPTTWTMTDTLGHTIPAGTTVAFRTAAGVLVPFVTVADVVVPAGSVATGAGAVTVYAVEVGTDKNGYVAQAMVSVDALSFLSSVASTATTANGIDAETDDEYLTRLVAELALLAPRPIKAADFAVYARKVEGVIRAAGLDNYKPSDDTFGNEKMVTIALVDADGQNVSAAVKTAVSDLFAAAREINFVVNIIDPTRTVVDITYVAVALPGVDTAVAQTAVDAALTSLISPAVWGSRVGEPALWDPTSTLRYLDVAAAIKAVAGIAYITTLTVNGGTVDVTLAGRISLPTVGTIAGVVT